MWRISFCARWESGITIRQRIVLATNSVCRLARFARFVPIDLLGWLSWWLLSQHAHTHTEDNCYTPASKLLSHWQRIVHPFHCSKIDYLWKCIISLERHRQFPFHPIGRSYHFHLRQFWARLSRNGTRVRLRWDIVSVRERTTYLFISCTNEPHTHHTICAAAGWDVITKYCQIQLMVMTSFTSCFHACYASLLRKHICFSFVAVKRVLLALATKKWGKKLKHTIAVAIACKWCNVVGTDCFVAWVPCGYVLLIQFYSI